MQLPTLLELLGGRSAIARRCNVTRQAVSQWREIPARFVLTLSRGSVVTPHDMRPDLYPHPLDGIRTRRPSSKRAAPPT